MRCRELDKLYCLCPELTETERAAVAQFALRLQNQFLHHPAPRLRSATTAANPSNPEARSRDGPNPRSSRPFGTSSGFGTGEG